MHDNSRSDNVTIGKLSVDALEFSLGLASDEISQLRSEKVKMKDDISYIQSQSMPLVFTDIPEELKEKQEDAERKLRQLALNIVDTFQF